MATEQVLEKFVPHSEGVLLALLRRRMGDRHLRLVEIVADTAALLEALPPGELHRAKASFRAGLVHRRRRDATGNPYLTSGHSTAAYAARTLEAIEVCGADLAELLDELGEEVRDHAEQVASRLFRCVMGPLDPAVSLGKPKGKVTRASAPDPSLPLSADYRIDAVCQRFEDAWKAGGRPRLEDFLGEGDGPERRALFRELLLVDLHYRRRAGETPAAEDYRNLFPDAGNWIDSALMASDRGGGADKQTGPHLGGLPNEPVAPRTPGYEIQATLGTGGRGVVYQARDTRLKRLVALKMIRGPVTSLLLARFHAEAEAVARLNHPHIVQIYEIGQCPGGADGAAAHYLALEFAPGGSLDRYLRRQRPTPHESARLVEVLARAVHAAHRAGVVHRDLKPANILLGAAIEGSSGNTPFGFPKVSDFGLARLTWEDGDEAQRTASGVIVGTPSYMAPEQASGDNRSVGPLVDVYALGAILYECLTGKPPFQGKSPLDTLLQVQTRPPVPPSQVAGGVPEHLDHICLTCLNKAPGGRYGSAADLADEIQRFLAGPPIPAPRRVVALGQVGWHVRGVAPRLPLLREEKPPTPASAH
jgi:hypothetical protein